MKTRQQVVAEIRAGRESRCLDGRDYSRLTDFMPVADWEALGYALKPDVASSDAPIPEEWTEANILAQLNTDLAFAFEKALDKRGISAGLMYEVVKMWMWVLEDPLGAESETDYAQYGLPFLKAVALKYGFDNPIGLHAGTEQQYSSE